LPLSSDPSGEAERRIAIDYCGATIQTKHEILTRISLAEKITTIARTAASNSRIVAALEKSRTYRATLGVAALSNKAISAGKSVTGAVDALKGLFKNAPEQDDAEK
jgi:hypothetical protein